MKIINLTPFGKLRVHPDRFSLKGRPLSRRTPLLGERKNIKYQLTSIKEREDGSILWGKAMIIQRLKIGITALRSQ